MAGLPPNYNFTNQFDPQLQASISQMQQHQQQQLQQQQQQQLQQPQFQHQHIQLQHIQQQQVQQQQTYQQQQRQLIQQLHQEARDRRERIRSRPFPTNVTQSVRDRQARGKDVYRGSEDEKTDDEGDEEEEDEEEEEEEQHQQHRRRQSMSRKGDRDDLDDVLDDDLDDGDDEDTDNEADILHSCRAEDFETRQRRAFAASVLDRPEQLMMYAQSTNDSIASQRHRFMTILCGYDGDEDWSNVGHHRASTRAAQERKANMRKTMNIDRRTA